MTTRTALFVASLLSTLILFAAPRAARATVTQPNGTVMPRDSMNGETQLYTLFSTRGETIDYRTDAAAMPAVFSPLCDFRATFVLKQSGSSLGVGWYNADPAATTPPTGADIHVIVPAGTPVGAVISGADIRRDPAYRGGAVGFALVGGQTHYTESRFNTVCTGCSPPAPWIMAVIYRSTRTPNAYYVAFEDGSVGSEPGQFNNDGDYNDYVYLFEGLTCMGGGEPCETGMMGACAMGARECTATGTTCRPVGMAAAERCNGVDDDCNGMVDDGMGLCPATQVCERGVCVARCVEGGCFAGQTCSDRGTCVETACATVTCPAGQICRGGMCRGACDGVTCPVGQLCRAGRCIDPCAGVMCETGQVCDRGACRRRCDCAPCEAGRACDMGSGRCVEPSCVGVMCAGETACRGGMCVARCDGAVCPAGQRCESGSCVDAPATSGDAGGPPVGTVDGGGGVRDAGGAGDAGARLDGGRRDGGSGMVDEGGCGCSAVGAQRAGGRGVGLVMLGLAALAVLARRRRT